MIQVDLDSTSKAHKKGLINTVSLDMIYSDTVYGLHRT